MPTPRIDDRRIIIIGTDANGATQYLVDAMTAPQFAISDIARLAAFIRMASRKPDVSGLG